MKDIIHPSVHPFRVLSRSRQFTRAVGSSAHPWLLLNQVVIISKTFTTAETMLNAKTVKARPGASETSSNKTPLSNPETCARDLPSASKRGSRFVGCGRDDSPRVGPRCVEGSVSVDVWGSVWSPNYGYLNTLKSSRKASSR